MSALHAATGGHPHEGGAVAVLIHGAGGNRTQWATQARHLAARGFDVVAYDLPGHGESSDPACESVPDYAAAVLADIDARGIGRFAVAGHSMGAVIALRMAADAPDRVTHLALVGAGLRLPVNPALLEATSEDPPLAVRAIIDWGHAPTTHLGASPTPGQSTDGAGTAVLSTELRKHPGALYADFRASDTFDGNDLCSLVRAPTLVISGERDMMTPPKLGQAAAAAIDGAEYVEVAGAGHFLMSERPAELSRALAAFFGS